MKVQLIVLLLLGLVLGACSQGGGAPQVSDTEYRIPLAAISDGQAHYYQAQAAGKTVRFFALQSPDGEYRAAFDACDVCYEAKKGYSQDGEFMICNNCGQRFHASRINVVKGGCNPAPLSRTVVDDQLVIALDDIAAGATYF